MQSIAVQILYFLISPHFTSFFESPLSCSCIHAIERELILLGGKAMGFVLLLWELAINLFGVSMWT